MRKLMLVVAFVACAAFVSTGMAGDGKKPEPKCPVSGKKIDKDASVTHNGGTVYFCCNNCPTKFKDETEKYTAKANYQLYVTGQAKLKKCPYSGEALNTDTKIDVGGMPVCFCCEKCQAKVKDEKTEVQIEKLFNDKSFKKGFEVKKAAAN